MVEKEIRSWKKVYESDLPYISYELKQEVDTPALIILDGTLGAGKTTFSKVFIDSDDETMSPTYSILYEAGDILHADLYRIKNREEIIQLEIEEYLDNKNYFLVEWGKKYIHSLQRELPEDFSIYILEISINDMTNETGEKSRNFELFKVSEL